MSSSSESKSKGQNIIFGSEALLLSELLLGPSDFLKSRNGFRDFFAAAVPSPSVLGGFGAAVVKVSSG